MRLSFQIALVVLIGLGVVYVGINNLISPLSVFATFYTVDINAYGNEVSGAIATQTRLLSGMWVSAGIFLLLSIRKFESHTQVLRLVFLGLALSSIGELISVVTSKEDFQSAIIKTTVQVGICIIMELWRMYLVNRSKEGYHP